MKATLTSLFPRAKKHYPHCSKLVGLRLCNVVVHKLGRFSILKYM